MLGEFRLDDIGDENADRRADHHRSDDHDRAHLDLHEAEVDDDTARRSADIVGVIDSERADHVEREEGGHIHQKMPNIRLDGEAAEEVLDVELFLFVEVEGRALLDEEARHDQRHGKDQAEAEDDDEVKVKVIHSIAGGVTESDVQLAKAANAIIIAFNVRPVGAAKQLAEKEGVEIKQYSVIYQALDDVRDAMKGMLAPVYVEKNIGNAEVRQTFRISNVGTIAGCFVLDGKLERNAGVRVIREGVVIHDGKLVSLKRFKDDVKEVSKGFECGIQIQDYNDIKEGDTIEAYVQEEVKR